LGEGWEEGEGARDETKKAAEKTLSNKYLTTVNDWDRQKKRRGRKKVREGGKKR